MKRFIFQTLLFSASFTLFYLPLGAEDDSTRSIAVREAKKNIANTYCLLIGINDYPTGIPDLKCCVNDTDGLFNALMKLGVPKDHIFLMNDKAGKVELKPTGANIRRRVEVVCGLPGEGDQLIISFSGHGVIDDNTKEPYWCPNDVSRTDNSSFISRRWVESQIAKSRAKQKILIVDCCKEEFQFPAVRGGLGGSKSIGNPLDDDARGFAKLVSCSEGQFSRECKDDSYGVFTRFLIQGLEGKADNNNDGVIKLNELFEYTKEQTRFYVLKEYDDAQVPMTGGEHTGDFVLATVKIQTLPIPSNSETAPPPVPVPTSAVSGTVGQVLQSFGNPDYKITCAAFSPDGLLIASGGEDNAVKIWNVKTGEQISSVGHSQPVTSVCFSPSGKMLLSTSEDDTVKLSKVENGESINAITVDDFAPKKGKIITIASAAFSHNEKYFVIGTGFKSTGNGFLVKEPSIENAALLFSIEKKNGQPRLFLEHLGPVGSVSFSPDDTQLLTGSFDRTAILWDVNTGKPIRKLQGHTGSITRVEFTRDGKSAMTSSGYQKDNTARLWNLQTGAEVRSFNGVGGFSNNVFISGASLSPDGNFLVTAAGRTIILWNTSNGMESGTFKIQTDFRTILFAPDGKSILVGNSPYLLGVSSAPPRPGSRLQLIASGLGE